MKREITLRISEKIIDNGQAHFSVDMSADFVKAQIHRIFKTAEIEIISAEDVDDEKGR